MNFSSTSKPVRPSALNGRVRPRRPWWPAALLAALAIAGVLVYERAQRMPLEAAMEAHADHVVDANKMVPLPVGVPVEVGVLYHAQPKQKVRLDIVMKGE